MVSWKEIVVGESKLVLHTGAETATWDQVEAIPTPEPTKSWKPIAHAQLVEDVMTTLERTGLQVKESAFATYQGGARFFGLLGLDCEGGGGDYQLVVGLRNSHDRSFPVGMTVGSRVFVCDNLAFSSEIQVVRRHTRYLMDDLPRLISTAVGSISASADVQQQRFDHYKQVELSDLQVHDILVQSLDVQAIRTTWLPKVLEQWRKPEHEEFAERHDAWRLWNGYTEVLKKVQVEWRHLNTLALQGLFDTHTRFIPKAAATPAAPDLELAV